MKTITTLLLLLSCTLYTVSAATLPVSASPASTAVGKAIEKTNFITEHKPDTQAEYYMYLHSALWCGPCRREMPKIMAEYEAMKKDHKIEIILVSHDQSVKAALQYLDIFSAPFAAVMYLSDERKALPGAQEEVKGIPTIIVTDAQGNVVHQGHASTFVDWKKFTAK